MKSYHASYFKTHFGAVLDRAGSEPVRIERRGREAAVLLPESEYRKMRNRALSEETSPEAAMGRLRSLALGSPVDLENLSADPRAAAILKKHS